jgi:CPA1 family monovalent cation:H+ antiporter
MHLRTDHTVDDEVRVAKERMAEVANGILDSDGTDVADILRDEFARPVADENGNVAESGRAVRNRLRARIVEAQRAALAQMRESAEIGDDAFHRIEERLDWAEVNARGAPG